MSSSLLISAAVVFTSVGAFAQGSLHSRLARVTSPIRDAGVLHFGTGTWTRGASHALQGPDTIYENTCVTGYFFPQATNERWTDEGRLPSPTAPTTASTTIAGGFDEAPGCNTSYTIQGFQIAYCTNYAAGAAGASINISFQDSYVVCAIPAPQHTFPLNGLPSTAHNGTTACWVITIDLDAISSSFPMLADGTGTYGPSLAVDLFGWSFQWASATQPASGSGPIAAGDPSHCTGTDGTRWDTNPASPAPIWPANIGEPGTGMTTQNIFHVAGNPTLAAGCYWFGGNPFASFHLALYSTAQCPTGTLLNEICMPGVGVVMACPCSNPPSGPGRGCDNSSATGGAHVTSTGLASLSGDTLTIGANNMRTSGACIALGGTSTIPAGVSFGQGVRCVGGTLVRLYAKVYSAGSVVVPQSGDLSVSARHAALGDPISPGTSRAYAVYYRDPIVPSGCPASSTFNTSDAFALTWAP